MSFSTRSAASPHVLLAMAAGVLLPMLTAAAAPVTRTEVGSAVKHCQAALPAYEGQIRKRPKALQNEGSTTVFVTCGFEGRGIGSGIMSPNARQLTVYFNNYTGELQSVTCTAVEGGNGTGSITRTRVSAPPTRTRWCSTRSTSTPPTAAPGSFRRSAARSHPAPVSR